MIAEIEDALVLAIKKAPLGYHIGIVDSYGGELSGDENAMALVMKRFPAVWVAYSGETEPVAYSTAKNVWVTQATFTLFVATRSARGEKFTRHSVAAGVEVGAYQIAEDLRRLVVNQDFGLAIQPFKPGKIKSLFNKKLQAETIAVYAVEVRCKYLIKDVLPTSQSDLLSINFGLYLESTASGSADMTGFVMLEDQL